MTVVPSGVATAAEASESLHENEWLSLRAVRKPEAGVGGYVYSHETRCQGRIVAVLPYRDTEAGREYLAKSEMTPCWGFDQVLSAITGGYEGGDIEDDAVREMLEETGYAITRDEMIPLGVSFASKSADTVYSLFSVDLTGRVAGEAIGDGSRLESESAAVWLSAPTLTEIMDPQVSVMALRLGALEAAAPLPAAADRELLGQAEDIMHSLALRLLGVSPRLKEPYTDMPEQSPWSMTIGPMASRAYDAAMAIRQHLGLPHRWASRALGTPPLEIENAIAEAVAAELARCEAKHADYLSRLTREMDATVRAEAAAERERIRQGQPVCVQVVPPNVLCMTCFRPLCRSCGACDCPENRESLCGRPAEDQP